MEFCERTPRDRRSGNYCRDHHFEDAADAVVNGDGPVGELGVGLGLPPIPALPSQVAADLYCVAELGFQDGVQVNCINPGRVRTARFEKRLAQTAAEHGVDRETALGIFVREEKITQVGEPEDIAGLVAFLLSKHGRYLHGSLIDADGGATKTV